jgi:hypothetical protein
MTTLTKPRKPRVRKTKALTPPAEEVVPPTEEAPPVVELPIAGGEGAAERGEGGSDSSIAAVPQETPVTVVTSPFVLDCPKCSASGKARGGSCYRCKGKGHQDFDDL